MYRGFAVALPLAVGLLSLASLAGAEPDAPTPASTAAGGTPAPTSLDLIRNEFEMDLSPLGVHTQILPLYQGRYAVQVTGAVPQAQRQKALALAAGAASRLNAVRKDTIVLPIRQSFTDPADTSHPAAEDALAAAFAVLKAKGVTLAVRRVPAMAGVPMGRNLAVLLSGIFPNLNDLQDAIQTAADCQQSLSPALSQRLAYVDTAGLSISDPDVQDTWPVTWLGRAGAADGDVKSAMASFVDAMNAIYGGPAKLFTASRDAIGIHLSGPRKTVLRVKAALALIDAPAPQVRLEIWPVQITSDRSRDADRASAGQLQAITEDIQATEDHMTQVHEALLAGMRHCYPLSAAFQQSSDYMAVADGAVGKDPMALDKRLCRYMFQLTSAQLEREIQSDSFVNRPFTTNEMLILMGISPNRLDMIHFVEHQLPNGADREGLGARSSAHPLAALEDTYGDDGIRSDREAVENFLDSVDRYRALVRALGAYGPPQGEGHIAGDGTWDYECPEITLAELPRAGEEMQRASAPVDGLLEEMVTSFQRDMEQMWLTPLLDRLQNGEHMSVPGDGGVSLIGRTTLVVSNRLQASLKPDLVSYSESTRPAPFGTDLLSLLAPANSGGDKTTRTTSIDKAGTTTTTEETTHSADTTGLSGPAKLLSGLPASEAALLGGALLSGVAPTYTKIAPGVSVTVLPSVSSDGSWADLDLTTNFGVNTSAVGASTQSDVWPSALPSGITSNAVQTHATVNGSKLFAVSSFSLTTLAPQAPEYIPVLGRLPVIGSVFQRPRGPKTTRYQDLLLVNAVVVPRALGLVGLYNLNKPLPYPRGAAPQPRHMPADAAPAESFDSPPLTQTAP